MVKLSQTFTKSPQTSKNTSISSHLPPNCIKFIPYTIARRICTIITNKNRRKTCLKELRVTLHQMGYPAMLIYKGFEFKKNTSIKTNHLKHNNEQPFTYFSTYNKNNPELFAEIIKNLEQLGKNDRIKNIQDTHKKQKTKPKKKQTKQKKNSKSKWQPKNVKHTILIWGIYNTWSLKRRN